MNHVSLALHIELRSGPPLRAGTIVLGNTGSADVRVWRTGNQWGDTALSFEVFQGNDVLRIVRQPQVYTRNVPSSVVVPAGTKHEWPFDLGDGEWKADGPIDKVAVSGAQLIAIYDVTPSPEAIDQGVWTGQLRSKPVVLDK